MTGVSDGLKDKAVVVILDRAVGERAPNGALGRLGTPDDCVGAYEFLADERMSGYMTGGIIEVTEASRCHE